MKKYQILCVDDQEDMLQLTSIMLEDSGYEIITKTSCIEALEFVKENNSKIIYIFSDYNMDEMNGLEFRMRLNEQGFDIPFAIITGFYDIEMAKQGMSLRVSAFIEKPLQANQLTDLIKDLGEKRISLLTEENEMVMSFVDESYPMLEDIENLIMSLETSPDDENILNTYFRLLHTIKGTASCVGLKNIPKFTHKYEDLVVKLQSKQLSLNEDIAEALLKGLDQLKFMYAAAKDGVLEVDITEALQIFEINNKKIDVAAAKKNDKKPGANIGHKSTEVADDKIGISVSVLDNFMELSGRLTVLRNTLIKSATVLEQRYFGDSEIEIVTDSLGDMHKVSSILQNEISEMRKVSLQTVYKPLRRVVRDSAKTLNKNIDLIVEGDELRVDTSIGKALSNSLVHMIRNSIDHGIELPEKRVEVGKSNTGLIRLKSMQDGENIIVELSDDGNGLNLNRIKQKAIEKNLYTEEQLKLMSDQKIFALIFDSGFSTAQQVSDISGRGVGMDMVRNSIESTGGNIAIDSKEGVGTRFILTLPVPRSVMIIKSLMIKSNDAIFSIPLDEVGEVIRLENFQNSKVLHNVEGSLLLSHQDHLLPLVDLCKVLHEKKYYDQMDVMNIVLVRGDGFRFGVIVDEILDIEEIVVKKMSQHLKNANCFLGVTFIGHGALALILNLLAIGEKAHVKFDDEVEIVPHSTIKLIIDVQEFMQFNFHQTKNYAFPLHLVNRLEEVSCQDVEFSGAMPIVRYRGDVMPLLFIERQLGLCSVSTSMMDLYPIITKVIVVDLHNKKFGIVVDEILDIGLTSSEIVTDNVDRVGFLGTVFIAEKAITIIDVNYLIDHYIEFEKRVQDKEFSKANYEKEYFEDEAA